MLKHKWFWPTVVTAAGVLGLTNGVWQYITEPLLFGVSQVILNVASLGVASYKDGVYQAAARYSSDGAAHFILMLAMAAFITLPGIFLYLVRPPLRRLRAALEGVPSRTDAELDQGLLTDVHRWPLPWLGGKTPLERLSRISTFGYVAIALLAFAVVAMVVAGAQVIVSTNARDQYLRYRAIVSPFVEDTALKRFDSRFALTASRDNYRELLFEMTTAARAHIKDVPDPFVW